MSKAFALASSLVALSLSMSASAAASVTIGQPATGSKGACSSSIDVIQPGVTSGNDYRVPPLPPASALVVTSWSTSAGLGAGMQLTMKIYRKVSNPEIYQVVGHDGPHPLTEGIVNTFPANVAVQPGDVLGLSVPQISPPAFQPYCVFAATGDQALLRSGNLADGQSGQFSSAFSDYRLNVAAVVAPANAFTLGKVDRNPRKGTATLTVDVPNPGEITISGNGVKAAGGAGAHVSVAATAPGAVQLNVRAKGKKKRKLNETGKVKLNIAVAFTPAGGEPSTQSTKLKLRKR